MNKIRLVFTFYGSFILASSLITLACLSSIYINGPVVIAPLLFLKIFTAVVIIIFINLFKNNEFYYYQNLGLSKIFLWLITMGIDMVIFVLSIVVVIFLR